MDLSTLPIRVLRGILEENDPECHRAVGCRIAAFHLLFDKVL